MILLSDPRSAIAIKGDRQASAITPGFCRQPNSALSSLG
jgi:hypothetical protein